MLSAFGAFAQGLGDAKVASDERKLRARELDGYEADIRSRSAGGGQPLSYGDSYGGGGGGGGGGGSGSVPSLKVADPVNTDLPDYARAFLNSISAGESAGAYNVRYTPKGGQTFELNGSHPRIFEPGPHGPSSAAGRYQFTATTWDGIAGKDTPFTEANQDKYAWELAKRDYRANGGGDLDADLREGRISEQTLSRLGTTWAALKGDNSRYLKIYHDSLGRYRSAGQPAQEVAGQTVASAPQNSFTRSIDFPSAPSIGQQIGDNVKNNIKTMGENIGRSIENVKDTADLIIGKIRG